MRLRMAAIGTPAGAHRAAGNRSALTATAAAHSLPAAISSSAAICTIHKYFLP